MRGQSRLYNANAPADRAPPPRPRMIEILPAHVGEPLWLPFAELGVSLGAPPPRLLPPGFAARRHRRSAPPARDPALAARWPELRAHSAFSFGRAASMPEILAARAAELELPMLTLCDRDTLAGAPRFHAAARDAGIRPAYGAELTLADGTVLPVLVENRTGWQNLCRLLTRAKLRAPKGRSAIAWEELEEFSPGLVALTGDEEGPMQSPILAGNDLAGEAAARRLIQIFGAGNVWVETHRHRRREDQFVQARTAELARNLKLPLLATNAVRHARKAERMALDALACIRLRTTLDAAGRRLAPNAERHLKRGAEIAGLFADCPAALAGAVELSERLTFSLGDDLGYQFPRYHEDDGTEPEPNAFLRTRVLEGARGRYGAPLAPKVLRQLDRELRLIAELGFAGYFLCVWDLVEFCRREGILIQGRGSAANSAVCYALGITAIDPIAQHLLFERFLSEGRKGWPDIDLDLPSGERRERVIQRVFARYERRGAAMVANVISFRGRMTARELGLAFGLPADFLRRFSALYAAGDYPHTVGFAEHLRQAGLADSHPRAPAFARCFELIRGLPRHLGQHPGGMVISHGALDAVVPLENAAMPGRSILQWDKDDCEDLGLVKVDLLGLGMMAVLQDTVELCAARGRPVDLATLPRDDPQTFKFMQEADTVGVFQIESRAQQATLPRMKPASFYDVAVEVALIRPGPIEGGLMHPYLARREGREPITYPDERVRPILERTLGVCIFQEQILGVAMTLAGFTPAEADDLRRAINSPRRPERMARMDERLRTAMRERGVAPAAAEEVVRMTRSYVLYNFPESHALSFGLLAYVSTWLKAHRPAEFLAGLLDNQPMGFYSAATLVQDARRHGLRVRPPCVQASAARCLVEDDRTVRLGLAQVGELSRANADAIATAARPFASLDDFRRRVPLARDELRALAAAGALNALCGHRRAALWQVEERPPEDDLFAWAAAHAPAPPAEDLADANDAESFPLAPMSPAERLAADFATQRLSVGPHPMALVRAHLPEVCPAAALRDLPDGAPVVLAGQVICRQRPGTARGVVFVSLEDETGIANAILSPALFERRRLVVTQESWLRLAGRVSRRKGSPVVQARRVARLELPTLHELPGAGSHDFR